MRYLNSIVLLAGLPEMILHFAMDASLRRRNITGASKIWCNLVFKLGFCELLKISMIFTLET